MQTKKQEVKDKIVEAAVKEFKEKGFRDSSIRGIASVAGLTKGSIYTYFKTKDDLYCSIVQPALDLLLDMLKDNYGDDFEYAEFDELYRFNDSIEEFRSQVKCIIENKELMSMLFFSSTGSSLEDFRAKIVHQYEKSSRHFYEAIGRRNPNYRTGVTELFIHSCAILYVGFIEEILIHDPGDAIVEQFVREMTTFVHYGTECVIKKIE